MKKQSTAKGFTILSAAGIGSKILAIIYVPILTLLIDNYGNGIYNAGYMMYLLVYVVTNVGLPVAISKLVSEKIALGSFYDSHRILKVSGLILISWGFVVSILTAVFARPLSAALNWPEAYLTILALSPTMFFTAISSTFRGYFQGRSNMLPTGASQIIEQLLNSILTVFFAWLMLGYGAQYAVSHGIQEAEMIRRKSLEFAAAGGTIGTSVGALGSAVYLIAVYFKNRPSIKREIKESFSHDYHYDTVPQIAKKVLAYGIPITLGALAVNVASLIDLKYTKDRLIAAGFSLYEANSMYGILTTQYQKLLNIPLALASALAAAIIPTISASAALQDRNLLGRRINESFKAIYMVTIPAAVGLAVLAKPIVTILFPHNVHGWDLLMVGSWVLVLIAVVQIQTAILQGIGRTHIPTLHMVAALIVKIIINYNLIAIKTINIRGAVIGSAVAYTIAAVLNHRSIRNYTWVNMRTKIIFNRPLLASVIMGIGVYGGYEITRLLFQFFISSDGLLNLISTSTAIALGIGLYITMMVVIRGITAHDLERVPGGRILYKLLARFTFLRRCLGEQ